MRQQGRRVRRGIVLGMAIAMAPASLTASDADDRFVCETHPTGVSIVDVLQATGEHSQFLDLLRRYDPEGFDILADPALADKTVWAPTDAAVAGIADRLASLSDAEIKAVLGYHISPPRRSPRGDYPILTVDLLVDAGQMTHRTRTGVLTGSDERTRTTYSDGVLRIEGARILGTAWCAEAGSVFSIDSVIEDVPDPSPIVWMARRAVRILLYEDIRFVIYSTAGAFVLGSLVAALVSRKQKRRQA